MTDFPHVRLVCCELCGRAVAENELRRVVLRDAEQVNGNFRAARVVNVCSRHADSGPLRSPREATKARTSKHRPQQEQLF